MKKISLDEVDFIVDMHILYSRIPHQAKPAFVWWLHSETGLFTHKMNGTIYFSRLAIPPLSPYGI